MDRLSDQAIAEMTPEERLELIERLWDSFDDTPPPLTDTQLAELRRRMDHFEEDRANAVPWEEVKAELLRRLG